MAGLKQIKSKIGAMKKSQTVTRAMEAVSAAKMRKAQHAALSGRAYARAAAAVLARVSGSRDLKAHPLAQLREVRSALCIVITSDKGLAGALNSAVLRGAQSDIKESGLNASSVKIIAVGRKAQEFFERRGFEIVNYYPNNAELTSAQVRGIVEEAAGLFTQEGGVDAVRVVYQNFVSTFEQKPTLRTVFPLSLDELSKVVEDIVPKRGAFAEAAPQSAQAPQTYTLEPGETTVLNAIVPLLAGVIVYHALLESQASEHSARMVAMKSATDKAGELQHGLTLRYNKARQAAITREVSEITGGMEAMAS